MAKQLSDEHKARIREGMRQARERKLAQQSSKPTTNVTVKEKTTPMANAGQIPDAFSALLDSISGQVTKQIDETVTGEFAELRKQATKNAKLDVTFDGKTHTVPGLRHMQLDVVLKVAGMRLPSLLVGMAGTGKTHAAEQVAQGLGIPYYTMSVGAQTSKSDIMGFIHANGGYVRTLFREAYENGGVFLMDEIDAGNANVLIQVNAALSNNMCAFPDKMVPRHKDFVFIASANTYGTGLNRQYVGRNQLDAATLDRFTIIDWDVDANLESQLAVGQFGEKWYETVKHIRGYVSKHNIRALITPRATQKGSQLLANGFKIKDVVQMVLLGSIPDDKKDTITKEAVATYSGK